MKNLGWHGCISVSSCGDWRDDITPYKAIDCQTASCYTGAYCQRGNFTLPTTFPQNQKTLLASSTISSEITTTETIFNHCCPLLRPHQKVSFWARISTANTTHHIFIYSQNYKFIISNMHMLYSISEKSIASILPPSNTDRQATIIPASLTRDWRNGRTTLSS